MAKSKPREPVTRERAIRVAVMLADSGGIESLSMRKLATELGIEAMSLYYHVKSKDDILDGMLDVVYSQFSTPRAGDEWRTAMCDRAESMRSALAQHPWAISIKARTSPGPVILGHLDSVIGCLRAAGFSMPLTGHALSLLDSYVNGFAQEEASLPLDSSGDIASATEDIMAQQEQMAQTFPNLADMAVSLILQPGYAYGQEFGFGLELILDGIAAAQTAALADPR
ncbi:TetR/AcrR family transcriptional regulator C-terminal domain-containing protein [Arthrobacter sp. CAN_C5]|uniref:TetR/AcrR family transcriptional regulator C-terminal domain-containing protein n=1 Tax=Arthrobacter sp. CAN_C5 TaxID=2760706 RepID=UPI001AE3D616|nr:TetR/AcrR family transcriptional regulator C-terminal domain-containing protein [Arthrobacter sp. CAN_C5]MBP2216995.1 AcrR family transcriptional regulator [Arthrobacter sp. CAN_C5]